MSRDAKKADNLARRDLPKERLETSRQKRLTKKLFCVTKRTAAAVTAEPEELRKSVSDEVKQHQTKRREMGLARAKYEDKGELLQEAINDEVEKHIETHKDYLECEVEEKAQEQIEKKIIMKQLSEKMEEFNENIERVEHEKEGKLSKNWLAEMCEMQRSSRRQASSSLKKRRSARVASKQLEQPQQRVKRGRMRTGQQRDEDEDQAANQASSTKRPTKRAQRD